MHRRHVDEIRWIVSVDLGGTITVVEEQLGMRIDLVVHAADRLPHEPGIGAMDQPQRRIDAVPVMDI